MNIKTPFTDFDHSEFWEDCSYARSAYIEAAPTSELVAQIEARLGYRLPSSYVALMHTQNGGVPRRRCFPATDIGWADDHVSISAFKGIGETKLWSLCGGFGSRHMIDNWDYPELGIYFGDCPTAGHQMFALDYRDCGRQGEPKVVYVNQERGYQVTPLAINFESFVRNLLPGSVFDEDPEIVKLDALAHVRDAPFSARLRSFLHHWPDASMPDAIRRLAEAIVKVKGSFALRDDDNSQLMYAAQFMLHSHVRPIRSMEGFAQSFPGVIAGVGSAHFGTGDWGLTFMTDWFRSCVNSGRVIQTDSGWRMSSEFRDMVLRRLVDDAGTLVSHGNAVARP